LASGVRRGDFAIIVMPREYGKPRPGLVIQNDIYSTLDSVVVCPLTTELTTYSHFRLTVQPSAGNGLQLPSQIMIDKLSAIPAGRMGQRIGRADPALMEAVDAALSTFLALG
jgi:mRNA interferase MazF